MGEIVRRGYEEKREEIAERVEIEIYGEIPKREIPIAVKIGHKRNKC